MIEEVVLRDGTAGLVVPLRKSDREQLVAEFEQLSPETRRHRFLSPVVHLSDAMLDHLVDDVDGKDHVCLVLVAETEPDVFDPAGIARMVRYPEQPDAADLAVTVRDDWHGRGVATALLDVLINRHRPEGVTHIVTEVANDNPASLAMLRRLGPTTVEDDGYGASQVVVNLDAAGVTGEGDHVELKSPRLVKRRADLRMRDLVCGWLEPPHRTEAPRPTELPNDDLGDLTAEIETELNGPVDQPAR
jgi:RimJ/RimL family protein N-acetyltransferase